MRLEELQRGFLESVLEANEPGDARLAIYRRGVRAGREGALAAAFPVVRRLVGAAFFGEAAARFGDAFASRSGDLHAYGSDFAGFLEGYAPARQVPCLADVARLEWAVHESRHAADGDAMDYGSLGRIPAQRLGGVRIRLRPSVRLVRSSYPVASIWEANQQGRDGTPARTEGGEQVVVRRIATLEAVPASVGPGEWLLLEAFARGRPLGQASEECERRGVALQPALAALAALDVLGGFEVLPA